MIDGVTTGLIGWKVQVNGRESEFAGIGKFMTRLNASFASCGAPPNAVEDMKGFARKVAGARKGKIEIDDPESEVNRSRRHCPVTIHGGPTAPTVPDFQDASISPVKITEEVKKAIAAVTEILSTKDSQGENSCAAFLKGKGIDALNGGFTYILDVAPLEDADGFLVYDIGIEGRYSFGPSDVERGFIRPNRFIINENGAFFKRSSYDLRRGKNIYMPRLIPAYENGTLGSQIVQILHELGHLVLTDSEGNTVLPPDAPKEGVRTKEESIKLSKRNTQAVIDNCKPQIDAYLKARKKK